MIKQILNWLDKLSEHFKMDNQLLKNGVVNVFKQDSWGAGMTNKIRDPDDICQEMLDDLLRISKAHGIVLPKPSRFQMAINFIGNHTWRKLA